MTPDAFVKAWRRAAPTVHRVLAARAPYRTLDDREDLLQDVCVRAFQHREAVEPGKFVTWCCRTAERLCVDASRHDACRIKTVATHGEGESNSVDAEPCARPNALDLMLARQTLEDTFQGLERITKRQRETIILRSEGLSYEEIGAIQGASAGAARCRMNLARVRARQTMSPAS